MVSCMVLILNWLDVRTISTVWVCGKGFYFESFQTVGASGRSLFSPGVTALCGLESTVI